MRANALAAESVGDICISPERMEDCVYENRKSVALFPVLSVGVAKWMGEESIQKIVGLNFLLGLRPVLNHDVTQMDLKKIFSLSFISGAFARPSMAGRTLISVRVPRITHRDFSVY